MQAYTNNNIYIQKARTGDQYVLKISEFNISQLTKYGWTERNANQRNVPILPDYKEFLRAYFELHSTFSWQTTYDRRTKEKYYRLRFRIFGNGILLESINKILHDDIFIALKTLQKTNNDKTFYLQYTYLSDIQKILDYVTGQPCFEKYWVNVDKLLKNPIKKLK